MRVFLAIRVSCGDRIILLKHMTRQFDCQWLIKHGGNSNCPCESIILCNLPIIRCRWGVFQNIFWSTNHTSTLQWRHNECDCISNHRRLECLLNRLFRSRSKKTSKLRVTGLCKGNSAVTGEFPAQKSSNTEGEPSLCHVSYLTDSPIGTRPVLCNSLGDNGKQATSLTRWIGLD